MPCEGQSIADVRFEMCDLRLMIIPVGLKHYRCAICDLRLMIIPAGIKHCRCAI